MWKRYYMKLKLWFFKKKTIWASTAHSNPTMNDLKKYYWLARWYLFVVYYWQMTMNRLKPILIFRSHQFRAVISWIYVLQFTIDAHEKCQCKHDKSCLFFFVVFVLLISFFFFFFIFNILYYWFDWNLNSIFSCKPFWN